ncbi:putative ABC transport system permease protein [Kitasatospora sp. GP30]|uniref:ABC transporter permease n=1 Tax=Kitasatospora sp. GP30 TaxID=3035084 RepID=UPI000C70AB8E|nr:ABC transporter permease [Kitasatospora sp. GP30]MDH6144006.1 putative ABC transport system permease protein [Kitasatospora sp. GP30]
MYRTALRNVLAHKGRLLMTMLAVLLGTAFVAGTLVFSDTFGSALKNSYSKSYDHLSVRIDDNNAAPAGIANEDTSADDPHLTAATVSKLAALPGVAQARGVVNGFTAVADKSGKSIGKGQDSMGGNFAPGADGQDARYQMVQGQGPQHSGEIALDKASADKAGYHVGDTVRVAVNGPAIDAKLTGIFTTDDPGVSSGNPLTLFDTASAQRLLLQPGQFDAIELAAAGGTSQAALQSEALTVLPNAHSITVQTADQLLADQQQMIQEGTKSMRTMLLAFAGISLFVGIFIIANTFTMLVAQRTRELALLRAIGASRKQVTRSVLVEALLIGTVAAVAGLLAGIGIGAGLQSLIGSLGNGSTPTGPLIISPTTVVAALATGIVVTVLSALLPARRAARIAPVAAMSSADQPANQKSLVVRNTIGAVITAGGLALIIGASQGTGGNSALAGGAAGSLIGIFILTPLLSRPLIAVVGPLLAALFGVSGKLARQNAVRNPRRTAATASALTIGLTLVSALTVLGASFNGMLDREVANGMKADYAVGLSNGLSISPDIATRVAQAPGVTAASPLTESYLKIGDSHRGVSGLDAAHAAQVMNLGVTSGSVDALGQGKLLVTAEAAKSMNLSVGSTVPTVFPDGTASLTVGGIFTDNALLKPMLVDNAVLTAHHVQSNTNVVLVKGTGGESQSLRQALVAAGGDNPLIDVQTKQDLKNKVSSVIAFALNMLYGLLAMSIVVAVLGVINTMAMSVFERKREIGMLRAIGLDRRAVKRMVRLESVVISLFGAVLGLVLGCFLAWAVNGSLKDSVANLTTVLPWGQLLVFLGLSAVVGLVAAFWPSRRAAKLDILDSIKAA